MLCEQIRSAGYQRQHLHRSRSRLRRSREKQQVLHQIIERIHTLRRGLACGDQSRFRSTRSSFGEPRSHDPVKHVPHSENGDESKQSSGNEELGERRPVEMANGGHDEYNGHEGGAAEENAASHGELWLRETD